MCTTSECRSFANFSFLILTVTGVCQQISLEFRNFTFHENVFRSFGVYSRLQKDKQADVGQHEELANTFTPGLDEFQSAVTFFYGDRKPGNF